METRAEVLSCSICLDLLEDPVTLPCGHSFCKSCIQGYWDIQDEKCPHCRRTFAQRPPLEKNIMLAKLVEELKKMLAGPEDVACYSCTGRKMKAVKSCLVCLTSYCDLHLQPHLEDTALRRHKLGDPSKQLQDIICSQHNEEKEIFCRSDQQLICLLCAVDQHKNHNIVSAAVERREREKEVDQSRGTIQQRIQEREADMKMLQKEERNIQTSADKAVKDSQETLTWLIQNLQRRLSDEEQQIRSRQESEVARVQGLQEQLEQEIAELKKKDAELQQLTLTNSHTVFLHNLSLLSEVSDDMFSMVSSRTHVRPHCCLEEVAAAVSASRDLIQDLLSDTWTNISLMLAPEPENRDEFLLFTRDITLDPNTASSWFVLSEGNRKVTNMREDQSPPPHPDRFTDYLQVLSKESLTGRCYWELEVTGKLDIAVSYKNICTSGAASRFGFNNKSWSLLCSDSDCSFIHNSIRTRVSSVHPSRVGVYLDHSAGLLSFYSVSDTMTILHRVHTTFTQPLHAGVWAWSSCEFILQCPTEMNSTTAFLSEQQFNCFLCQKVFSDPVSIPCGHSFCFTCITPLWESPQSTRCPKCHTSFSRRPELCENSFAREMSEQIRAVRRSRSPGRVVYCDVCTQTRSVALKSCVGCLMSYCEAHLSPHLRLADLSGHQLTDPEDSQPRIRARKLAIEIGKKINEKLKKLEEIRVSTELSRENSELDLEESRRIFSSLFAWMERRQELLEETIRRRQLEADQLAKGLMTELQADISELQRRRRELESDDVDLLQFPGVSSRAMWTSPHTGVHSDVNLGIVRRAIDDMEQQLQSLVKTLDTQDHNKIKQYAAEVQMDARTANAWLVVSDDGTRVWDGEEEQDLEDLPERFTSAPCVLGTMGFTSGRHYWEVDVGDKTAWDLGLARTSINRKGKVTLSPEDGYWAICLRRGSEFRACADEAVLLHLRQRPRVIGVFVDIEDGMVSFYDAENKNHIYSFTYFHFTEEIIPFFNPEISSDRTNRGLLTIRPVDRGAHL
ncbi:E3 ubiquitin/ISG15 ligase TRIM25-like [Synchiropus picturatus]